MLIDLHVHTLYSHDAYITLQDLKRAWQRGIGVAITDHNNTRAWEMFRGLEFIKGEEIETPQGEIIGLFMNESIKKGLDAYEVIDMLREQDALIYIPHPYSIGRKGVSDEKIMERADVVEVCNGKEWLKNLKAQAFCEKKGKMMGAGSDAHMPHYVGKCGVIAEDMTKESVVKALKNKHIQCGVWPLALPFLSKLYRRWKLWTS